MILVLNSQWKQGADVGFARGQNSNSALRKNESNSPTPGISRICVLAFGYDPNLKAWRGRRRELPGILWI
jgi:hypothetical protein